MSRYLTHLECSRTGKKYDPLELHGLSRAGAPLLARYDFEHVAHHIKPEDLLGRRSDLWRYRELLPVDQQNKWISLGEGMTPLIKADRLGQWAGFNNLYIKDESLNPTGSFKARGLSMAVNAAYQRGVRKFAIASAGNAAGALAAYAGAIGAECTVFMPEDTPMAFKTECRSYGASVILVNGLISDCGRIVAGQKNENRWFDVSTLKEPYRLEGKKTMGFELFEQFGYSLPDVIIYPTGGGTGLIGMWKAFDEMEKLGWIDYRRPRMISVQSEGCAPIVRAFEEGRDTAEMWPDAHTVASGLRVPAAIGDFLILRALKGSGGTAVAVSDEQLLDATGLMAKMTGVFPAPEGGATLAALLTLKERQLIGSDEKIVLFNTGSGYKYLEQLKNSDSVSELTSLHH